ncbi:MAG TPA: ABC transporter substrate-binding protein [Opitutaceae bacterium]
MVHSSHRLALLGTLALGAALMGCRQKSSAPANSIVVGEFASLTGKEATFGQSSNEGLILGIEEANATGGALGKQIHLVVEDDGSTNGEAITIVKKLISRDHVVAVLGEIASGRSLEAAPICQEEKIPMISPGSTNPAVTQKGDYIFRVCFIDPFQGTAMAKFAHDQLHLNRVAVLSSATAPYSAGLAHYFEERFRADGGEIPIEEKYNDGDKDFRAELTAIKAANVQGIFVPGYYSEVGLICAQARELGITAPLMGGDGWESPIMLQLAGAAADNCYYSTHYSPQNTAPNVQSFVKRFQKRWNGETPDAMAALGYDCAGVFVDALKRAGSTDPQALRDAIAATKNYPGVTGVTTIGPDRNAVKPAVIIELEHGESHFLQTVAP